MTNHLQEINNRRIRLYIVKLIEDIIEQSTNDCKMELICSMLDVSRKVLHIKLNELKKFKAIESFRIKKLKGLRFQTTVKYNGITLIIKSIFTYDKTNKK